MRVECLAQEHNAVPRPGLEPGPFDPESSALTIRPPRLLQSLKVVIENLVLAEELLLEVSLSRFPLPLHPTAKQHLVYMT